MNRTDLQSLADSRVADADVLLQARRWPAAYYLLGYAVECALKACAARQFRQDEVPDKTVVNDFYTHRLDKLLGISGVKAALELRANADPGFQVNWNTVRDWSESSRLRSFDVRGEDPRQARCGGRQRDGGSDVAENAVVKEQLTSAMVDAGAELTAKLDELGVPVTSALWLFEPESNEWRLLFASPEVSAKGPRDVYAKIRLAIEQLGPKAAFVPLSAVGLLDPGADLARLLKVAVRTGPGVSRVRFSKNVIDGHFIDDALIYRAA